MEYVASPPGLTHACEPSGYPQVVPRTGPAYGKRTVVLHAAQSNLRFNNYPPCKPGALQEHHDEHIWHGNYENLLHRVRRNWGVLLAASINKHHIGVNQSNHVKSSNAHRPQAVRRTRATNSSVAAFAVQDQLHWRCGDQKHQLLWIPGAPIVTSRIKSDHIIRFHHIPTLLWGRNLAYVEWWPYPQKHWHAKVLGAMISVQNHRHTILLRHRSGMISSGHCASDGSMELSVVLGRPLNGPPILDGDLAKWLAWDYLYISRSSHPDIRDPCPRPLLLEKLFAGGCGGFKQDPYERSRNPKPTARECPSPSRHKIEIHQLKTGSWWEHPSCVLPAKQHQNIPKPEANGNINDTWDIYQWASMQALMDELLTQFTAGMA